MLTGYNTDVSYGGEVFHVQTEDKGVQSPIILSLVYRAGTILAAKRTAYHNLIQNGVVDEVAVAQILNRQHQILVAAIQSGKSDKLAELSRQQGERSGGVTSGAAPRIAPPAKTGTPPRQRQASDSPQVSRAAGQASLPAGTAVELAPPKVVSPPDNRMIEALTFDQIIAGYLQNIPATEQLRIDVLYPSKFRAGDAVTVRAAILKGGMNPTAGATVQLQILGTKIEPQMWTGKTDLQGLVSFQVKIPVFTAGAAALILKAQAPNGQEAEAKFMIKHK